MLIKYLAIAPNPTRCQHDYGFYVNSGKMLVAVALAVAEFEMWSSIVAIAVALAAFKKC